MSADLMLVCHKRNEYYEGNNQACVIVDETSGGMAHTELGAIFQHLEHNPICDIIIARIKYLFPLLEKKSYVKLEDIMQWLEGHKGEKIALECW